MTTYVGSAVGVTTCTLPTHQAGDLLICNASRDGSGSLPGLPAGWTRAVHATQNSVAGMVFFRIATAAGTTDPVSSSATSIEAHVYRPDSGKRLEIGAVGTDGAASGTGNTLSYPGITLFGSSSWVVGFGNHRSPDTASTTPPTGMTNRSNANNANDDSAGHDTNGAVSSWTTQTVAAGGTDGAWRTFVVEIREVTIGTGAVLVHSATDTVDGTTFTFSNVAVGDSAHGSNLHLLFSARASGTTALSVSSITVDGNAASIDDQVENSPLNGDVAAIATIAAPAGPTVTVVATVNTTCVRGTLQVFRGNGTKSDSATSVADDPTTTSVDVPAGGYALAVCMTANSGTAEIWTGLGAVDAFFTESSIRTAAASRTAVGALTGPTFLCNFGTSLESVGVFVGYAPPAAVNATGLLVSAAATIIGTGGLLSNASGLLSSASAAVIGDGAFQVQFDAFSQTAAGTGDLSWTHTPVGTPKGVRVSIVQGGSADNVTGVTYGGVALARVASHNKTTGETTRVYEYFLGSGVPAGAQTVQISTTGSTSKRAACYTLTATGDLEIVDIDTTINSDALADPLVTLSLAGRKCWCAIAFWSGTNDPTNITPLTNWSVDLEHDFTSQTAGFYKYDIVSTADVSAGWDQVSDDAVAVAVAIGVVSGVSSNAFGLLVSATATIVGLGDLLSNASGLLVSPAGTIVGLGSVATPGLNAVGLLVSSEAQIVGAGMLTSVASGVLISDLAELIGRLRYYDRVSEVSVIYTDVVKLP